MRKNQEISELKSRIAEVMALIPQPQSYPSKLDSPGPIGGAASAAAAAAAVSMSGGGGGAPGNASAHYSKYCSAMSSSSPMLQQQQQQQQHQPTSLASLYPIGGHRLGGIGNMPSMPIGAPAPLNMKPDAFLSAHLLSPQQQQQLQQQNNGQSGGNNFVPMGRTGQHHVEPRR